MGSCSVPTEPAQTFGWMSTDAIIDPFLNGVWCRAARLLQLDPSWQEDPDSLEDPGSQGDQDSQEDPDSQED